ncbi:MAG: GAF domain-containing protein [Candidatus Riflebacteria bacterium]|nr:GAF domain-containing protein [Candidatus Riflebacteria bacterium]
MENLVFIEPSSPFILGLLVFSLALLILCGAGLLYLLRYLTGDSTVKLVEESRKKLEKNYIDKLRGDFRKKQDQLDAQMKEYRRRFSTLFMKVRHLSTTLEPNEIFKGMNELLTQEIGISRFIIFLHDRERNELYPFRWNGYADDIRHSLQIPVDQQHVLTFAFSKRQLVYRFAATEDPATRGLVGRSPLENELMALPIYTPEKVFGVIHIDAFTDGRAEIDESDLRFFQALGAFIGMALENANILLQTRGELTSTQALTELEVAEKKRLQEIFSRYASSELVDVLMKNTGSINLGGATKNATILFSDIAGFTNFSSRLTPEEVVRTMNQYLSRMTEVVLNNQGEIDKFIGDAVMARFGVLVDLPSPGISAVRAAWGMLEELKLLMEEWKKERRDGFAIRIGIASGPVLAGNIGSERRMEFTVMGTTVNLASRLEALNKELKTTLLIDETTFNQVKNDFQAVPRENIEIRGMEGRMTVYEVLGPIEGAKRSKVIPLRAKKVPSAAPSEKQDSSAPVPVAATPVAANPADDSRSEGDRNGIIS